MSQDNPENSRLYTYEHTPHVYAVPPECTETKDLHGNITGFITPEGHTLRFCEPVVEVEMPDGTRFDLKGQELAERYGIAVLDLGTSIFTETE